MSAGRMRFERTLWWAAFTTFVVTGASWTMAMPLLGQPDEPSHAARAAAVAQGELTWKAREEATYENFFFVHRTNTVVDVPEGYADLEKLPVCFSFIDGRDASCAPRISSGHDIVEARPYTGTYPPLAAIVQSPGGHFDAPVGLVVMRLCTVVFTAALLASAVVAVRRLGGGANAVGLALVLTPVTLSIMAAINPSALEIAAAACLWPSLVEVLRPGPVNRRAVWRATFASVVMILSRPISPAFFVAITVTAMIAMPWRARARELMHERRAWIWGAIVAVAFGFAAFWILRFRPDRAIIGAPDPRSTGEQIKASLGDIPERAGQLVGPLGWLDVPLPGVLVWSWLAVAVLAVLVAMAIGSWRRRLALVVLVVGVLVGPTLAEVPSAGEFGLIWQGRYTLPFAIGLPVLAMWTLHERGIDRSTLMRAVGIGIVVAGAAANLLAVAVALTDRQTGRAWPLDVELGPQVWSADVRGWVVLTVAGAGLAGLAALLATLTWRRAEGTPSRPPPESLDEPLGPSLTGAEAAVC